MTTQLATIDFLFRKLKVEAISCSVADSFKCLGDRWEDDRSEARSDFFLLWGFEVAVGDTTGGRKGEWTIIVIGSNLTGVASILGAFPLLGGLEEKPF